ncbi:hypothetical protein P171DRAFT_522443 [Karstenula rhodostoma CBS 690.94]|uniref:Uncharacterized protein n=1 Tax=Karstenula rhodostoma CBS 690.94 TaxID=1392251 RepID=A0A9P4UA17_9PLEO|nr:hypothetical protein P171DRAFT_522443 [Karstenula rhodostoma CBS 690.94]
MAPRSAALTGLYNPHRSSTGRRNSHFYMLSNKDMPLLASVFQSVSAPQTPDAHEAKARIQSLPRHLRASGFHKSPSPTTGKVQPGYLCDAHKRLKKGLCYELMALVQHEMSRVGRLTYSIVVSGELDAWEEMRVRQLECVPQMYVPGFDAHGGAPGGHEPICPGFLDEKGVFVLQWGYEVSRCPACMLSRIGGESKVVFALLAGLVARISTRARGHREDLKSRRVRFVKEWLEAREDGRRLVDDAFFLGGKMRDIKQEQRRRAREERMREERAQAREARDFCGDMSRPGRAKSRTAADAAGYGESVIDMDISESFAPQHRQASRRPTRNSNPPTDQNTATGVDAFRPGSWRLRHNVPYSKEDVVSAESVRGTDRDNDGRTFVGVDVSEPFNPAPRQLSNYRPAHREPDADELFMPAPTQQRAAPVRDRARRYAMAFEGATSTSTSTQGCISIASSFASNVSLSDLRAPSADPSLIPKPLRTPSRRPPTIPKRSMDRVPQPHPMSIYGTAGGSSTVTDGRYAEVSPPSTPTGHGHPDGHALSHYDVSPPSSPELDEFEVSPLGTPVMYSRPVTPWSGLYES